METPTASPDPPQRADARRNRAAIIDAAIRCLAVDPAATLGEIAEKAGVGRVTLYAHFGSRADLIREVVADVLVRSSATLEALDTTGEAADALMRLLEGSWTVTHQYGGLIVAAEATLPPAEIRDAHERPALRVLELLERGRAHGTFRSDMPISWQIDSIQAIIHAASGAVHRGDIPERDATQLIQKTVLGILSPHNKLGDADH